VLFLAAAAAAATAVGWAAGACSTPSSEVDGGDLLGVFDRDAGEDAAADGGAEGGVRKDGSGGRPGGSAGGDAAAPALPMPRPAAARQAPDGSCVAPEGQPATELRRTMGRPPCRGAQVLEWRDPEGSPRYACVYSPPGVETRAPLPVVLFFHAEDDNPTGVEKRTGLRKLAAGTNLTGDPAHTGFIVLAPQGRAFKGQPGARFDTGYTGPDNVDVAVVDHFLGELAARKLVDRARVYALGMSAGGHMAATYAMMRADRVAAFATFGTDAPPATWACPGPPPPAMVLYRACDAMVACESVERWLRAREAQAAETPYMRLGEDRREEPHCTLRARCPEAKGAVHHNRWPKSREEDLLRFFAARSLSVNAASP